MAGGWTYILTNKPCGVLYVGVTADLAARMVAHREGRGSDFVKRYNCMRLVLVEHHSSIDDAIRREKTLKNWKRDWKLRLIADVNPEWDDLFEQINQ